MAELFWQPRSCWLDRAEPIPSGRSDFGREMRQDAVEAASEEAELGGSNFGPVPRPGLNF